MVSIYYLSIMKSHHYKCKKRKCRSLDRDEVKFVSRVKLVQSNLCVYL